MVTFYRGFSTIDKTKKFRVTDQELVKRDLLNHFSIRKGEKLMNPNFGTIIWNVIYDPLTEELKSAIIADVNTIINYDPRISVDNVNIVEYENGIMLEINIRYVQTNQATTMRLQFDSQTKTITAL